MPDAILELRGVHKRFGDKQVLRGADLALPPGSVLGLLGKNGAGKTTLIKCALGLQRPQEGVAFVFGRPALELGEEAKARLGYVPQEVALYSWMRVRQLLDYTSAFYPRWDRDLVERLVREWELNPTDWVGPLSPGQQQRLALILALGHRPELLVLDEPAASLDPAGRRQFLKTVLDRAGECSVLFSTHITSDLERVADRVAVLQEGRVTYQGELDALKDGVKRLRVVAGAPLPGESLHVPGQLRCRVAGREALVSVRDFTPELPGRLAREWSASVEVEDLNLEDIFLELHHD